MARIAIGGIHHETNTFSNCETALTDFQNPSYWPGLLENEQITAQLKDKNIAIAGAIKSLEAHKHEIVPLIWCAADPGGKVTHACFDELVNRFETALKNAGKIDALYLDINGAMVAEHVDTPETDLIIRLQGMLPKNTPIVISADLHANLNHRLISTIDALTSGRAYPHIDFADPGYRAGEMLHQILIGQGYEAVAFRKLPFLMPITVQSTLMDPAKLIMDKAIELEESYRVHMSLCFGFPYADVYECGPSVLAYAHNIQTAERAVNELAHFISQHELEFKPKYTKFENIIATINSNTTPNGRPVLIADIYDNPSIGAMGESLYLLNRLHNEARFARIAATVCDPKTVKKAFDAGVGAKIECHVGKQHHGLEEETIGGVFTVTGLVDHPIPAKGPAFNGFSIDLGKTACVSQGNLHIIATTKRAGVHDLAVFKQLHIKPEQQQVIVFKGAVQFMAEFPNYPAPLIPQPPNFYPFAMEHLNYKHLRSSVRIFPKKK
jgi:microcystin degradation protein MlrC